MSRSDVELLEKARQARATAHRVRDFARRAPSGEASERLRLHAAWLRNAAGLIERRVVASKPRNEPLVLAPPADARPGRRRAAGV